MIRIQNLYYMLAYAFQVLKKTEYKNLGTEEFQNTADLLSEILIRGVSSQIRRGLGRSYVEETGTLNFLRGKINLAETIKNQSVPQFNLVCRYDTFSVNSYLNQILKTTLGFLMRSNISSIRKKKIRSLLLYFKDVDALLPHEINWNLRYDRNNQTYRMLVSVCYLVIKGLLQKSSEGNYKMMDFLDEQRMCRLYEKFILEYYRKEHPTLAATPSHIKWAVDDGFDFMLPTMKTDIALSLPDKKLIIDAKYYDNSVQTHWGISKLHSDNLYQIFTYVKNEAQYCSHVSGLLLYAKTDETDYPRYTYQMSGTPIGASVLDLSKDFKHIRDTLDHIANEFETA